MSIIINAIQRAHDLNPVHGLIYKLIIGTRPVTKKNIQGNGNRIHWE